MAKRDAAEAMAIDVLWALSGRQFSCSTVFVRPCAPRQIATGYTGYERTALPWQFPVMFVDDDPWSDVGCGCDSGCRTSGPGMVHLPGPVQSIDKVIIDGATLEVSQYVLERDVLYRRGDSVSWPDQNLSRPDGEPGTWSVTYQQGLPAPTYVGVLTATLASELVAACTEGAECRIPRTVTGSSRRGVSYDFDPSKMLAAGKTGLPEVDMWLASVNPNQLAAAPEVF